MRKSFSGGRTRRGGHHILLRRGGALRTLGTFILAGGSISLILGIYLFRDTGTQQAGDQSAVLIAAAFFLAGGIVPLLYLLQSVLKRHSVESLDGAIARLAVTPPARNREASASPSQQGSSQLPFQRIYVDSTRVRR
jgi:hypothetical protein